MNDRVMRAQVARFGMRVICLACQVESRHFPETQGRLRSRRCPSCGLRASMRLRSWVVGRGKEVAHKLVREHRTLERVFDAR